MVTPRVLRLRFLLTQLADGARSPCYEKGYSGVLPSSFLRQRRSKSQSKWLRVIQPNVHAGEHDWQGCRLV